MSSWSRCYLVWRPPVSYSGLAVEARFDEVGCRETPAHATTGSRSIRQRGPPAVSVIIATYNAGPLLAHALDALAAQSLPAHLIEILVVDDGSTDGTWSYLSELEPTRSNIKIFQQPHTGGPSAGRNRALSEATGSYVFFHDADDYLGPDALRRLLAVAQQNDSDIVVASVSWIGKPDAAPGPRRTVLDADILDDGIWHALTPHKLIRRSLIEHLSLRFCDDMVQGEDQVFMASASSLPARSASWAAGTSITGAAVRQQQPVAATADASQQAADRFPDGRARRRQHDAGSASGSTASQGFLRTLPPALNRPFMVANAAERNEFIEVMQAQVFPYMPHSVLSELEDRQRLRMLTAKSARLRTSSSSTGSSVRRSHVVREICRPTRSALISTSY